MNDSDSSASTILSENAAVKSELLCFVTEKSRLLPLDDLVKICTDFYREEEFVGARNIVEKAGHRLPKRQGNNKLKYTAEDLIKTVLRPDSQLPTLYAVDLSRIPLVDIKHCDASAILVELQTLHLELRV